VILSLVVPSVFEILLLGSGGFGCTEIVGLFSVERYLVYVFGNGVFVQIDNCGYVMLLVRYVCLCILVCILFVGHCCICWLEG
jgi:hypothetical protein